MVDRGGWVEADAVLVKFCRSLVNRSVGIAVHERRTIAAAFFHGLHASIALVGIQMTSSAPDLLLPARGFPELGQQRCLFDLEPFAFERRGGGNGGDTITLFTPMALSDNPSFLTEPSDRTPHHFAPGDVVYILLNPNAVPYCRTGHQSSLDELRLCAASQHAADARRGTRVALGCPFSPLASVRG